MALLAFVMPSAMLANVPANVNLVSASTVHCDGASPDGKQPSSDQGACAVACAVIASRSFELNHAIAAPMAAPVGRTASFEHGSPGALDPPPPRSL